MNGRELHSKSNTARESGDFTMAISLLFEALHEYAKTNDDASFAEACASLFLTERHLFDETGYRPYLIKAKFDAMASVQIARENRTDQALVLPLFNLAKALETLGELNGAVETYRESEKCMIENPPEIHNRPAVLYDIQIHLALCEYSNGDTTGIDRALELLVKLEATDEESYTKAVWLSGGYMKIADLLFEQNPEEANKHLTRAKEIIEAYRALGIKPDLEIRLKQWRKLKEKLS